MERFTYLWGAVAFGVSVEQRALSQDVSTVDGAHFKAVEHVGERLEERLKRGSGYAVESFTPFVHMSHHLQTEMRTSDEASCRLTRLYVSSGWKGASPYTSTQMSCIGPIATEAGQCPG